MEESSENFWSRSFSYGCSFWSLFNLCKYSKNFSEGECRVFEKVSKDSTEALLESKCEQFSNHTLDSRESVQFISHIHSAGVQIKQPLPSWVLFLEGKTSVHIPDNSMPEREAQTTPELIQAGGEKNKKRCSIESSSRSSSSCQNNCVLESSGVSLGLPDANETVSQSVDGNNKEHSTAGNKHPEKDGKYFLTLVDVQQNDLQALSNQAEPYLTEFNSDPVLEEAEGLIRAAIGKANLLMEKKFKQFRELCNTNMNPEIGRQHTTNEDLAGFWDMVSMQVDGVKKMFDKVESLKVNQWKSPPDANIPKISDEFKTPVRAPRPQLQKTSNTGSASKSRDEARKKLLAVKLVGRQKKADDSFNRIEIFVNTPNSEKSMDDK